MRIRRILTLMATMIITINTTALPVAAHESEEQLQNDTMAYAEVRFICEAVDCQTLPEDALAYSVSYALVPVDGDDPVGQWTPLVSQFFEAADVNLALRIISCESGGDPNAKNPHSSASGLFQHLARFWPDRSRLAGWPGADIFDPVANVAVAADLFYRDGPSHWYPSEYCWGQSTKVYAEPVPDPEPYAPADTANGIVGEPAP
jgi:hypothetical protein